MFRRSYGETAAVDFSPQAVKISRTVIHRNKKKSQNKNNVATYQKSRCYNTTSLLLLLAVVVTLLLSERRYADLPESRWCVAVSPSWRQRPADDGDLQ